MQLLHVPQVTSRNTEPVKLVLSFRVPCRREEM